MLKIYMITLELFSSRIEEDLYLYISITTMAISLVLFREEQWIQRPVHYTNYILDDAETRYPNFEKLTYGLILTVEKLRPYFQAYHIIIMMISHCIIFFLKLETMIRLLKWVIALNELDISYKLRIVAKALIDFVTKMTFTEDVFKDTK